MTRRRAFALAVPLLAVLLWPLAAGALPPLVSWPFFVGSSALTLYALLSGSPRARTATLTVVSTALTIGASDLALRYLVPVGLLEPWPRLPKVRRFLPNLDWQGYRFGDLSRMAGVEEWRENKRMRLITDSSGFRNERPDPDRPLDVILLGDSFGAAISVMQEDTWTALLSRDYGLHAYNLSSPGAGPWAEYVNLWAEKDRLRARKGAVLIWQLFTGNDLDDEYGSLEMAALPWRGPVGTWLNRLEAMRARSPLRELVNRPSPTAGAVVDRRFLNGRTLLFYKPYIEASARTSEEIRGHRNYSSFRATLLAVETLAASLELRLVVVLLPSKEEVYSWAWKGTPAWTSDAAPSTFAAALADLCREAEVPLLDAKPLLVVESRRLYERSGQILYWYDDTHMNAAGNRFIVPVIHRELMRP